MIVPSRNSLSPHAIVPAAAPRRQFLLVMGGAALGSAVCSRRLGGEDTSASPALQTVTRSTWALGAGVSITAVHPQAEVADRAIASAFDELKLVEQLMSIYREDSQLSRLNRERELTDPHPYFVEVLQAARSISARGNGAFDITVQPLWSLMAAAKKAGMLPSDEAIDEARGKVDWRQVEVSPRRVRLKGEAMITLNGIAQGFAADRVEQTLKSHGVRQALINTGEIRALGHKATGDAWNVGVQHPRREDAFISVAELAGRCLATSGDYATAFSDDLRWNHLFDPATGRSPTELASVSIAAPSAMLADALSTAVCVLGEEQGVKLIRTFRGVDALLVTKDGRTQMTAGFPAQA